MLVEYNYYLFIFIVLLLLLLQEYERLVSVFDTYRQTVVRTSNEMCQYKMSLMDIN